MPRNSRRRGHAHLFLSFLLCGESKITTNYNNKTKLVEVMVVIKTNRVSSLCSKVMC